MSGSFNFNLNRKHLFMPPLEELMEDARIFDKKILMETFDNDEDLISEILDSFIAAVPRYLSELQKSMKENNCEAVFRMAHTIKGSSANIAAYGIREVALQIEMAGKNGEIEKAESHFEKLEEEFARLEAALKTKS